VTNKPLLGIRILDLSRLLPGPFCSLLLADLGAEVIKIEDVAGGDYARFMTPFIGDAGAYFLALNPGKKSLALNLKTEPAREIFLKLAETSHVILETFRPGTVDRLGVGYETVRQVNPRIVYCAISGYGQNGPDRDRAGHDLNYIARAGLLGLTGPADGPPAVPAVQIADLSSGMYAAIAILAALHEAGRSGVGAYLDIGMLDSALSWLVMVVADFASGERIGRGHLTLTGKYPCYNVYQTKDGEFMTLAALEPKFWMAFCRATGREDLLPLHFADTPEAHAQMRALFASRTQDEWVTLLRDVDCCCEPVQSLDDVFSDPQIRHRGLILEAGVSGHPFFRLSHPLRAGSTEERGPVPRLGEHTAAILHELGYDDADIATLVATGAVSCG